MDTQNSTITIYVRKTGIFSGLGHEHEVTAPIHSGAATWAYTLSGSVRGCARTARDPQGRTRKRWAEVQATMLGPEVLDSGHYRAIVFKFTAAEPAGSARWTLPGNLTLHGQTQPITVEVTLKEDHYLGSATVKQTDFGIKPPGKPGVRAKDEVRVEFDVRLAS
ncbi:MAG TPA: YceI family protein [Candidatus Acidoferrum sp.]|nr:YceI family protein [Candidatus Acidoferrum sp.]